MLRDVFPQLLDGDYLESATSGKVRASAPPPSLDSRNEAEVA